jgi:hypothetical protein
MKLPDSRIFAVGPRHVMALNYCKGLEALGFALNAGTVDPDFPRATKMLDTGTTSVIELVVGKLEDDGNSVTPDTLYLLAYLDGKQFARASVAYTTIGLKILLATAAYLIYGSGPSEEDVEAVLDPS